MQKKANARSFQYDASTLCGIYPIPPEPPEITYTVSANGSGLFAATDYTDTETLENLKPVYMSKTLNNTGYIAIIKYFDYGDGIKWWIGEGVIYSQSYYFFYKTADVNGKIAFEYNDYGMTLTWSSSNNRWEQYDTNTLTVVDYNTADTEFPPITGWMYDILSYHILGVYYYNNYVKDTPPLTADQTWLSAQPEFLDPPPTVTET